MTIFTNIVLSANSQINFFSKKRQLISLLAALSKRVALLSVSNGRAIMPSAAAIDVSSAVIKGEMMDRSAS